MIIKEEPLSRKAQKCLAKWLQDKGIVTTIESPLSDGHRIDIYGFEKFAGEEIDIGIEIKSSIYDLKSGYGLNFRNYMYEYLALLDDSSAFVERAIGHLYLRGCQHVGVLIMLSNDGGFGIRLIKEARPYISPSNPIISDLPSPIARLIAKERMA